MNKMIIKGRLVRDPELNHTNSDISVAKFTVAVDRPYQSGGEKKADFFNCIAWRQRAEFVFKYFTKGQEALVEGEMQSRTYEAKDGSNRTAWELVASNIEFCGSKGDNQQAVKPAPQYDDFEEIGDDDLPF